MSLAWSAVVQLLVFFYSGISFVYHSGLTDFYAFDMMHRLSLEQLHEPNVYVYLYANPSLAKHDPSLAKHGMPCLGKQCRSRSVGF